MSLARYAVFVFLPDLPELLPETASRSKGMSNVQKYLKLDFKLTSVAKYPGVKHFKSISSAFVLCDYI